MTNLAQSIAALQRGLERRIALRPGRGIIRSRCIAPLDPAMLAERRPLAGGITLGLRAIRPEDRFALREQLFLKLGKESLRNRFLCLKSDLSGAELTHFCQLDFRDHVAIVAEVCSPHYTRMVGVGRLVREIADTSAAEIAITVQDHYQGQGIGSLLFDRLLGCARTLGIDRFEATMFASNRRMVNLMHGSRLPCKSRLEDGILTLSLDLRARPAPVPSRGDEWVLAAGSGKTAVKQT